MMGSYAANALLAQIFCSSISNTMIHRTNQTNLAASCGCEEYRSNAIANHEPETLFP